MSADADHEVIDSPEALFRHLAEAHGVEEALDLDPETAPLQFWLRRHAELEREARAAPRWPEPEGWTPATEPQPQPEPVAAQRPERPGAGREGRRPASFGDPLVEAFARALAGRGHGEAAVRGAIRGYASPAGGRSGEAAVRGDLIEPMLRAAAERLLGGGQPPAAGRPPPEGPAERRTHAPQDPEGSGEPRRGAPVDQEGSGEPRQGDQASPPEAAWAVFWADLADTGTRHSAGVEAGDDDLMAVADAVQRRRRRRRAEREPKPLRR
jgi:hypothetical protein